MAEAETVEESYVLVELAGIIDNDFLSNLNKKNVKILGVDTANPIIQLGNNVFSGEYKTTMGTAVLFDEAEADASKKSVVAVGEAKEDSKRLAFKCMTDKKLVMKRAFLQGDKRSAEEKSERRDE